MEVIHMEETLGKRIVANRKKKGLTQDQLAEKLGITAQAVSKWENDQSCPDIAMLPKLADIFGITTDALLGCEPNADASTPEVEVISDSEQDSAEQDGIHLQNGNWEFHWDSGRKSHVAFAIWVLLVGGILLAKNYLPIQHNTLWDILWPSALLVFGVFGLYPKFSVFRAGCALCGGYFLLGHMGLLQSTLDKSVVLPVCLLLFGLYLLAEALRKPKKPSWSFRSKGKPVGKQNNRCYTDQDCFCTNLSFGEKYYRVPLPRLRGGEATVSFGELTVDLTDCAELTEPCCIDASCSFGELEFRVPRHLRVETTGSTCFAALEVKGEPSPDACQVIYLTASANFGEITVHYI
jgi:transcriptional regulator with XRE-family HTH domain